MCDLIELLSRLKKSSIESVDSADNFNDFQRYMHVERSIEKEIKDILYKVKEKDKALILLCGSVGDGKSHMLAYLKNQTNLLDGYKIINDATESQYPNKTSIECLSEDLLPFADYNLSNNQNSKIIVAINLGTLSNFLYSEQGGNYKKLRAYVENSGLISNELDIELNNEYFYNINFANYQMYELTNYGIDSYFLKSLFSKVFSKSKDNPFYNAYLKCESDALCNKKCPIYANYKLLLNEDIRNSIIQLIEKCIVCEKLILSTRAVLNLIYDIMVAPEYEDENNAQVMISKIKNIEEYLQASLPFLLFERGERSVILESVSTYDPILERNADNDLLSIKFNYSDNLINLVNDGLNYNTFFDFIETFKNKASLKYEKNKHLLNKLNIRLRKIEKGFLMNDDIFNEFISSLYAFNIGDKQGLRNAYNKTNKAIYRWNGNVKNDNEMIIPIGQNQYTITQEVKIKNNLSNLYYRNESELKKFTKNITLNFTSEDHQENLSIELDFKLYSLINKVADGYCPNINDKNLHVNFNELVNRIIKRGEYSKKIIISENRLYGDSFIIEKNDFDGYSFYRRNKC